ncbi:MAG: RluA family pseudouridine synthase [Planctomycetota bacterium]
MDEHSNSIAAERIDLTIHDRDAGERLDKFLARRLQPVFSRSYLASLIQDGKVQVNGGAVKPSYVIAAGDRVTGAVAVPGDGAPAPESIAFDVIHEDEALLVVNKRPGLLMHPGPGTRSGTLVNGLVHRYPDIAHVGVVFRPGIVHRLDRDTSGIVVVARTNEARERLVQQFKDRTVKKEYRAIVIGKLPFDSDYIDLPLAQDPRHGDRMRVDLEEGKPSSTFYEVIERLPGFTFVRVTPFTGRTHQIRVHLSHLGFPVAVDSTYGKRAGQYFYQLRDRLGLAGKLAPSITRHALHAFRLEFEHPTRGGRLVFEAELPADMQELLTILRSLR